MVTEVQADRHKETRRAKDADQAEHEAIMKGSVVVDRGVYDDRVAGAMDDYEVEEIRTVAAWQRTDLAVDDAVGQVQEEVERRIAMMGALYPFTLSGGLLAYKPSSSGFYEFCLAASLSRNITSGLHVGLPRTFERLSALLVARAFGSAAEHLHLGSPRDVEIGTTFRLAMGKAHERTKEWFWGPDYGLPEERSHTGDEGVDFVVWKRPPDRRIGSLFVLGQCACGDDWNTKFGDINLTKYRRWFRPLSYVEPVRAFSTPYHLGDGWLIEALPQAGLIFDRARLTILAEQFAEDTDYASWQQQISDLTGLVLARDAA
ncbi:MAG: hypothetical protein V2I43_04430 [Parvularcula sp.]|jgi:hypothetical protein|nr:hypothetical protein [Parvularcula sp.]